jgi:endonuclease/exonuclease/phosphatase family metal-dependent hydrolase
MAMMRRLRFAALCLAALAFCCAGARIASAKGHTLRVLTYNIHVGVGMDKQLDLKRIAEVIKRERADLVGLQEVDRGVERTKRVDEIAELARLTGMEYAFANNLRYQGGWYGVAVLSRFPLERVEHWRYANRREAERRGFLRVRVSAWGRAIDFVTTHLDYQHEDGRVFESQQLLEALRDDGTPLVVTGDFNEEPDGEAYRLVRARFADAWEEAGGRDVGRTYPADKPAKRIDYVFHKGARLRVKSARVVSTEASDHRPLLVSFELDSAP